MTRISTNAVKTQYLASPWKRKIEAASQRTENDLN